MDKKGVLSNLKFIFFTTLLLVLMFSAVVATVLNTYRPVYRVSLEDKLIGYYEDEEQFEEVYNALVIEKEQMDPNVKVYLDSEPVFSKSYIRHSLIDSQNLYSSLRDEIKTEFTIYHVAINDETKMTFNSQDEANHYVANLKVEVPKVKSEVTAAKVETLGEMTTLEIADNIYKDVVSRNKPVIIPKSNYGIRNVTKYTATKAEDTVATNVVSLAAAQGGIWPTTSRYISSGYGYRGGYFHSGVDIAGKNGDPVYAYKSGLVTFSGWDSSGYGNLIKVSHGNGLVTYYAHNSKLLVRAGEYVEMGQVIAKEGSTGNSTGNHVHFEIRINGKALNPYGYIVGK